MLQKGLYRDNGKDDNNFFCGAYLLDYKMAFLIILGDYITIKTIIENPSDISYNKYPKKI
jgi:hypothetical protein